MILVDLHGKQRDINVNDDMPDDFVPERVYIFREELNSTGRPWERQKEIEAAINYGGVLHIINQ